MYCLEEDVKRINNLPRDKFQKFYTFLNDMLFEMPGITIEDLKEIKKETEDMDDEERNFFSNEKLRKFSGTKKNVKYLDEESTEFIKEVKASNVTEISDSGYFYKKISNCLDDIFIEKDDCESEGELFNAKKIDEDTFNFYVRDCFVTELDGTYNDYLEFVGDVGAKDLSKVHVRNPLTCKMAKKRCFCKKCCGSINTGGRELTSKNIGFITSLAVTETSTQASLSSMNEGTKENINVVLEKKLPNSTEWENVINIVRDRVKSIGYQDVQSRWYYISLLSRYVFNENKNCYVATSFMTNSNYGEDLLGAYIFQHNEQNLKKMINKGEFRVKSLKSKSLFGIY